MVTLFAARRTFATLLVVTGSVYSTLTYANVCCHSQ